MFSHRSINAVLAAAALTLFAAAANAQGEPPPEEHSNDIHFGRSESHGTGGEGAAFWFADDPGRLDQWLGEPRTMLGNVNAPAGVGRIYYNLGFDVIREFSGFPPRARNALQSATVEAVSVAPGLEMLGPGNAALFSADPASTAYNNTVPFPFLGAWHRHFFFRAWRPGTYQVTLKITNAVSADGAPLSDSQEYTLTLRNRPVFTGSVLLPGWARVDDSPNRNGNMARVHIFPADSSPSTEGEAISVADVFLDENGGFQIPENLPHLDTYEPLADGPYRIGVQPITAPGLGRLLPGNITLSAEAPEDWSGAPVTLPIGDANRDGVINDQDESIVTSGSPEGDVNGDGSVDQADLDLVYAWWGSQSFPPDSGGGGNPGGNPGSDPDGDPGPEL